MCNNIGEVPPSDSREVITDYFVPGKPHKLRISSRTDSSLKICWNEPMRISDGVNVQYKKKNSI